MALCVTIALNMGGCPPTGPFGPVAEDQLVSVDAGVASTIVLAATDADSDILTFIILSLPQNGELADPHGGPIGTVPYTLGAGGADVTYTPDAGFDGNDSFDFTASDGQLESDPGTISIRIVTIAPGETFDADATLPSLAVAAGTTALVTNNAVLTITGDATIDGTLFATAGRIMLDVQGDLIVNGTIRALDPDAAVADDEPLSDQPSGIVLLIHDGALTLGASGVLSSTGPIVLTDDESQLTRTPAELFDEVEDVSDKSTRWCRSRRTIRRLTRTAPRRSRLSRFFRMAHCRR
jgi:hypothetical protein